MKNRILVIVISLLLVFSLVACNSSDSDDTNSNSATIKVESLDVYTPRSAIDEDESIPVSCTVLPHNAINKDLEWYSLNEDILKVSHISSYGVCTFQAVSPGVARVYAKTTDGSDIKSNEVEITVMPYYQISLNASTLGLKNGNNTGNTTLTIGGVSYKISYQNVQYSRSSGTFSLGENTGAHGTVNQSDDSYIAIGRLCHNTNYSGKKIKITTKSSFSSTQKHFKIHTYYYGDNGSIGNVTVGNYGGTVKVDFSSNKTVSESYSELRS